jgi:hypothetical protein
MSNLGCKLRYANAAIEGLPPLAIYPTVSRPKPLEEQDT